MEHWLHVWVLQYKDIELSGCPKEDYKNREGSRWRDVRAVSELPWFIQPRAVGPKVLVSEEHLDSAIRSMV